MNHSDWIQILLGALMSVIAGVASHYGAKNGASQDK